MSAMGRAMLSTVAYTPQGELFSPQVFDRISSMLDEILAFGAGLSRSTVAQRPYFW